MPLNLPNLDDRRYADLVAEARALIPSHAPEWTNHNPSDPGITLIELFAYLSEMLIYRLNRVTDDNVVTFLRLLNGPDWKPSPEKTLKDQIRETVASLRQQNRAVIGEDFERLALEADSRLKRARCIPRRDLDSENELARGEERPGHVSLMIIPAETRFESILLFNGADFTDRTDEAGEFDLIADIGHSLYLGADEPFSGANFQFAQKGQGYQLKLEYFNGKDLSVNQGWKPLTGQEHELEDRTGAWTRDGLIRFTSPVDWARTEIGNEGAKKSGYWMRISTTTKPSKTARSAKLTRDLTGKVAQYLEPRRLLTTRIHVVKPRIVKVGVRLTLRLKPDAEESVVRPLAVRRLNEFLSPLPVGAGGRGWPFGRNVYVSEIYELLDRLDGVDYVEKSRKEGAQELLDEVFVKLDESGAEDPTRREPAGGDLIAVKIGPDELPEALIKEDTKDLTFISPIKTADGLI